MLSRLKIIVIKDIVMYQMGTVAIIRTSVVVPGRTFVSYLIKMSTQVKELNDYVNLSIQERVDLELWLRILLIWNMPGF
jgi:hypothetical protein